MRKHAIIAYIRTGGSDKCFTVNKVWEPCAMTLFSDNDTSVKTVTKMMVRFQCGLPSQKLLAGYKIL